MSGKAKARYDFTIGGIDRIRGDTKEQQMGHYFAPDGTPRDTNGHENGVPCCYGQELGQ
jgi:hypothetical protein